MEEGGRDFLTVRNFRCLQVPYIPKRNIMVLLAHTGVLWFHALRLNLSVAIVAMVTNSSTNTTRIVECPGTNNHTFMKHKEGEFVWSSQLQGIVLGSFFYGYLFTQVLGGRLAEQFGGRRVFGIGLLTVSLLSLLSAVGARVSVYLFIAIRAGQGIAGGVIQPAVFAMLGQWAPEQESAKMTSFIVSGTHMGTMISQLLAGVLAESGFLGGWPSVFYVMGTAGVLSSVLWLLLVTDTPVQHTTISPAEREYIEKTVKPRFKVSYIQASRTIHTPWRAMFTSLPVWAFIVAGITSSWAMETMMAFLPTYMDQVLHFDIRNNGIVSCLPYLIAWIFTVAGGIISDFLIDKIKLPTVVVRKLLTCSGVLCVAAFIVAAGFTGCDVIVNVISLTLGIGFLGLIFAGWFVNPRDIAPNYAGTIFGICNTFSTVLGFVAPYVTGYIIGEQPTQARWRIVFLISGVIAALGSVFYAFFGSGQIQPWSFEGVVSVHDDSEELDTNVSKDCELYKIPRNEQVEPFK